MHCDQVKIDTDLARKLIRDQFPRFGDEEIVALDNAGTTNVVFRIGANNTARFRLRKMNTVECERLLKSEAAAMAELREWCTVPTPQSVGIGRASVDYPMPWSIQTWIEGTTTTPDALSDSTIFALDLARLIRRLRTADVRGRYFDECGRGGNLPDHDHWMEECFSNSERLLNVARLRHLWSVFRKLPSTGIQVMSHKDLIPANLLVRGECLVGVLDGGGFGPADPALDLVAGWHLLDSERRKIFREAIQVDELEWQRGAAWAFQQAVGLVWYYRETNPTMSALGRSTIHRLLESIDV